MVIINIHVNHRNMYGKRHQFSDIVSYEKVKINIIVAMVLTHVGCPIVGPTLDLKYICKKMNLCLIVQIPMTFSGKIFDSTSEYKYFHHL
jgi:hypothetical protein